MWNPEHQIFTVNSIQQSHNQKHFKNMHGKALLQEKAFSLLTLLGSLLLLTITSPHSLICPQEEMWLGIGCMSFLCCGNGHYFLWQARAVLMSDNSCHTQCHQFRRVQQVCHFPEAPVPLCLCRWIVKYLAKMPRNVTVDTVDSTLLQK